MIITLIICSIAIVQPHMMGHRASLAVDYGAFTNQRLLPQNQKNEKFSIKKIIVEGTKSFAEIEVIRLLGINIKDIIDQEKLNKALRRLKEAYLDRGFIQIRIDALSELVSDPIEKRGSPVNLLIRINEGPSFYIRRIEFIGNNRTSHSVVQRATGIRLDDPFNPSRIDSWIQGLNRLKRFEKIKKEDVEITINDQEHFVDILFRVKELKGIK